MQATDGGEPPLHNHATVNITVIDANDNAPVFTQAAYAANVIENSGVGRTILTLTATDLDKVSFICAYYEHFLGFDPETAPIGHRT